MVTGCHSMCVSVQKLFGGLMQCSSYKYRKWDAQDRAFSVWANRRNHIEKCKSIQLNNFHVQDDTPTRNRKSSYIPEMCWYLNAMGYLRIGRAHFEKRNEQEITSSHNRNGNWNRTKYPERRENDIPIQNCVCAWIFIEYAKCGHSNSHQATYLWEENDMRQLGGRKRQRYNKKMERKGEKRLVRLVAVYMCFRSLHTVWVCIIQNLL